MGTFIHRGDNIIINGERFDYSLFKQIETEYEPYGGQISRIYQQGKKHYIETKTKQIPQPLNWRDGNRYIARLCDLQTLMDDLENEKTNSNDSMNMLREKKILEDNELEHLKNNPKDFFDYIKVYGKNENNPAKYERFNKEWKSSEIRFRRENPKLYSELTKEYEEKEK